MDSTPTHATKLDSKKVIDTDKKVIDADKK